MKMLKRKSILSLCLAIVLIASLFTIPVAANNNRTPGDPALEAADLEVWPGGVVEGELLPDLGDGAIISRPGVGEPEREILSGEYTVESVEVSEPMHIEQFLNSRSAVDLDDETRALFETALDVSDSLTDETPQYTGYEFTLNDAYIHFDTGEMIAVEFIKASEMDAALRGEMEAGFETQAENIEAATDIYYFGENNIGVLSINNIFISNLRTTGSQPLALNVSHNFIFNISNTGSAAVHNVFADIFMDNNFVGQLSIGTIPGNTSGATVTFGLGQSGAGGDRTITVFVGNRSVSNTFRWQQPPPFMALETAQLTSNINPPIAAITNGNNFSVLVANVGNMPTQTTTDIDLLIGGNRVGSLRIGVIQPTHVIQVSWSFGGINRSGHQTIGARTWNPVSNTTSGVFNFSPDGCGLWSRRFIGNATNISISVDDTRIPVHRARAAANQWNGITNRVRIPTVEFYIPLHPNWPITPEPTGFMFTAILGGNSGGYFRPHSVVGNFVSGDILINRTEWEREPALQPIEPGAPRPNMLWNDHVLVHEIGHLLGLGHPHELQTPVGHMGGNLNCRDFAVMQGPGLWTDHVTAHDRQALINRFGH